MSENKRNKPKTYHCKEPPTSALSAENSSLTLSIIKALPGSIYWKDKNGVYLGCNDAMLEMTGMKSIIGKLILKCLGLHLQQRFATTI